MRRNLLFLVITVFTLALLAACSSNDETSSESETNDNNSNNDEVFTVRFAMSVPDTHASPIAFDEIVDEVKEKSDGRLILENYENGQLYPSDREAVEAVQLGNLEATTIATPTMATFHERFSIFDMPFLFNDRDAAYAAMDGELGNVLSSEVEDLGFYALGFGENGFRHILNNKKPIEKPEDMKGLKFRVMENKVYEEMFDQLGANSSPLAFGELYTALQQGVYDGMDNPISLVYTMKFNEVQDYLTLSNHTFAPVFTVINKEYYESLPEDLQEILQEGMDKYHKRQREITVSQDEEYIVELENDVEINELTEEQKELFIEELQPIYEKYEDIVGKDLMDLARQSND